MKLLLSWKRTLGLSIAYGRECEHGRERYVVTRQGLRGWKAEKILPLCGGEETRALIGTYPTAVVARFMCEKDLRAAIAEAVEL